MRSAARLVIVALLVSGVGEVRAASLTSFDTINQTTGLAVGDAFQNSNCASDSDGNSDFIEDNRNLGGSGFDSWFGYDADPGGLAEVDRTITIVAPPEPTTLSLLAIGLGGGIVRRLKRRR